MRERKIQNNSTQNEIKNKTNLCKYEAQPIYSMNAKFRDTTDLNLTLNVTLNVT